MLGLKKELTLLSHSAAEEYYDALSSTPVSRGWVARCLPRGSPPVPPLAPPPPLQLPNCPAFAACGEPAEGEWLRSSEEGSQAHKLALHRQGCRSTGPLLLAHGVGDINCQARRTAAIPCHAISRINVSRRAAYDGDLEELRRLLPRLSMRQKLQLDAQGNTVRRQISCADAGPMPLMFLHRRHAQALHCAVLRHQHHAIEVLLDAGLPADSKNERQWNPIDEAVALQDAEATKLLYRCECEQGQRRRGQGVLAGGSIQQAAQARLLISAASSIVLASGIVGYECCIDPRPPSCSQLLIDAKRAKKEKKAQLVSIMAQLPDFKLQAGPMSQRTGPLAAAPLLSVPLLHAPPIAANGMLLPAAALGAGVSAVWPAAAAICPRRHLLHLQGKAGQGAGMRPPGLLRREAATEQLSGALFTPACGLCLPVLRQVGKLLRVDGTLMGLDDRSHSFIPRWKRGRFTLLVNAGAG